MKSTNECAMSDAPRTRRRSEAIEDVIDSIEKP